ncbi:MAG: ectoine/hydroxyectoine ABC transporter permease subunit EhuD [Aggregatilineales bacterium]
MEQSALFDWNFALEILPQLLEGLWVTIQATFFGFIISMAIGLFFALARRSENLLISAPIGAIVEFIKSTPLLVQLFIFFYILPRYGFRVPAFQLGVFAIGLHFSTYTSEVYRAGINAVPRGQWEAARALNFTAFQKWTRIILPQALPPMIPALGNYLIAMFKETAQLSAITVVELMLSARIIGTSEFRFVEPITLAGILYFAVSYPSSLFIQQLENRFGRAN